MRSDSPREPTRAAVRRPEPLLVGGFRLLETTYAPHERMAPHAHAHASVSFVLSGELQESVGRREELAGPLSVVVKPAGVMHADAFGPRGARILQVVARPDDRVGSTWVDGWRWHHARAAVPEFVALIEAIRHRPAPAAGAVESRVWEALGALAGFSARQPPSGSAPAWLLRAREELDDRLIEAVEVRELAASAGVHPISLTRAFKRHFGETVTGYRRRERLRRAARLLARGGDSISRVAHAAGFSDHSHLCREFGRATGIAPARYRRLARLPTAL